MNQEETMVINIANIFPGREKEAIDDLKDIYSRKIVDRTAWICALVPEGEPMQVHFFRFN